MNIIERLEKLITNKNDTIDNINQSMQFIYDELNEANVKTSVINNRGYKIIIAEVGEGNKVITLNGHVDVVPACDFQFDPVIKDGYMYGRGSYDMLGALSVFIEIIKELNNKNLNIKVMLMIVPTEETDGTIGTKFLLDNGYVCDFAICGEPTDFNISVMSKGVLQLELEVKGKSCHGSRPWEGVNPIIKGVEIVKKIEDLEFIKINNKIFNGSSVSLNFIKVEQIINKVPEKAILGLDIRYIPELNYKDIINQIMTVSEDSKVNILKHGEAVTVSENNYYINELKNILKQNNVNSNYIGQHGAADTVFFQEKNINSIEFGIIGSGHHGENEKIDLNSLDIYKKVIIDFIIKVSLQQTNKY
jgi:succinyl-diaminopimelate desuccinylase